MNGCLGKTLFVITLLTLMFLGYPYFTKFLSDSAQDRIHQWETTGEIIGKAVRNVGGRKVDEKTKEVNEKSKNLKPNQSNQSTNDNTKN